MSEVLGKKYAQQTNIMEIASYPSNAVLDRASELWPELKFEIKKWEFWNPGI
jgi:hypothetical protein